MKRAVLMKAKAIIISSIMILALPILAEPVCYANDLDEGTSYEALLHEYKINGNISEDSISIKKIPERKANSIISLPQSSLYNFEIENAYSINRTLEDNKQENTVYADIVATPKATTFASTTEPKQGRVSISCTLGYERLNRNTISYVKGTYVGGKVTGVQNGIQVKSVSLMYHECGPYITASGGSGIATDYKKTYAKDVSKMRQFQKTNLSRTRYFETDVAMGSVDGKYIVKYRANRDSKIYTISVNAKAHS